MVKNGWRPYSALLSVVAWISGASFVITELPHMRQVTNPPVEVGIAFRRVRDDATHARVFFHTWWALVSRAIPDYHAIMSDHAYVDFFHACRAGFLTLVFVSLGRLLDGDRRSLGLKGLQKVLTDHGYTKEATQIDKLLSCNQQVVERIRGIRNKAAAHTDREMTRNDVYETYQVTPDEIRDLVGVIVDVVNDVEESLWSSGLLISSGERQENAMIALLSRLRGSTPDDSV